MFPGDFSEVEVLLQEADQCLRERGVSLAERERLIVGSMTVAEYVCIRLGIDPSSGNSRDPGGGSRRK